MEFYEARTAHRAGLLDHALFKLECARREIVFAIQRVPKESYKKLLSMIDSEFKLLKEFKVKAPIESLIN